MQQRQQIDLCCIDCAVPPHSSSDLSSSNNSADVSHNHLTDLSALGRLLPCLVRLDASDNAITSAQSLTTLTAVRQLWLTGNPIATDPEYRTMVAAACPFVVELDGVRLAGGEGQRSTVPAVSQSSPSECGAQQRHCLTPDGGRPAEVDAYLASPQQQVVDSPNCAALGQTGSSAPGTTSSADDDLLPLLSIPPLSGAPASSSEASEEEEDEEQAAAAVQQAQPSSDNPTAQQHLSPSQVLQRWRVELQRAVMARGVAEVRLQEAQRSACKLELQLKAAVEDAGVQRRCRLGVEADLVQLRALCASLEQQQLLCKAAKLRKRNSAQQTETAPVLSSTQLHSSNNVQQQQEEGMMTTRIAALEAALAGAAREVETLQQQVGKVEAERNAALAGEQIAQQEAAARVAAERHSWEIKVSRLRDEVAAAQRQEAQAVVLARQLGGQLERLRQQKKHTCCDDEEAQDTWGGRSSSGQTSPAADGQALADQQQQSSAQTRQQQQQQQQ